MIRSLILSLWKKTLVSSANIRTLPVGQQFGKSFMNMRKNKGPRTEPWGTPQDIERVFDLEFPI